MRRLVVILFLLAPVIVAAREPSDFPLLIPKPDAFHTLVNPQCSHCRDEAKRRASELRDDDRVLCWIRGYSNGGAIPIRFFLTSHRVISDSYGVFVYDPEAGFARGFAPSYDFSFYGWRNGVMVMKHKDGTLYSCLTGKAFDGPKKGTQLKPVPTLVSNWGDWLNRYPQTVAYLMFDKYKPVDLPKIEAEGSLKSRKNTDTRLPADEFVIGVAEGETVRAYRVEELKKKGFLQDSVGDQTWIILWDGSTNTAAAYLPVASANGKEPANPRAVSLSRDDQNPSAPYVDKETGSHWDITGRAVEGALKGWTLKWLNGTQIKWFAWAAEYPETQIRGN
jgi:hypothetical protein